MALLPNHAVSPNYGSKPHLMPACWASKGIKKGRSLVSFLKNHHKSRSIFRRHSPNLSLIQPGEQEIMMPSFPKLQYASVKTMSWPCQLSMLPMLP